MFYRRKRSYHCSKTGAWYLLAPEKISFYVWVKELFFGLPDLYKDVDKDELGYYQGDQMEWDEFKMEPLINRF